MPLTMTVRKVVAIAAALAALTVAFVAGAGSGASATQGQPVIAGQENSETVSTTFCKVSSGICGGSSSAVLGATDATSGAGLKGQSYTAAGYGVEGATVQGTGVWGHSSSGLGMRAEGSVALRADGSTTGIIASSLGAGDAIDGQVENNCCSAVYGLNGGTGNGVAGRADTGTGVLAASTGGIGLKVDGKAQFSRSGTAVVTGTSTTPKSSIRVSNVALTSKSLVLTTPQKNVAGVWIQAAVPNVANSYVTIYLNKTVTVSYPVAWFIVEKP